HLSYFPTRRSSDIKLTLNLVTVCATLSNLIMSDNLLPSLPPNIYALVPIAQAEVLYLLLGKLTLNLVTVCATLSNLIMSDKNLPSLPPNIYALVPIDTADVSCIPLGKLTLNLVNI